ncbi:MAG TPA: VWA domain-containing protein [Vicinamibacterales bacterium]|jgi:VWFA-related protein
MRIPFTLLAVVAVTAHQTQRPPTFRAETRLVVLQATVRDAHGALVSDLDQSAFTVYENGTRQPITLFRRDDVPVSIGLLIDNSGSMRTARPRVEAAARAFANASNPLDEVFVENFADTVHVDVPMTSDLGALNQGLGAVDAIGGTALYDALTTAQAYLDAHATRQRRALVVITDGNDNASETTLVQVERQAEARDTVMYAIGLFGAQAGATNRGRREIDRLTTRTGGSAYYPASLDEIDAVALQVAHQIRSQYTIAYAPLNQSMDGSYRAIRVNVAGHGHLSVQTRSGYRALAR